MRAIPVRRSVVQARIEEEVLRQILPLPLRRVLRVDRIASGETLRQPRLQRIVPVVRAVAVHRDVLRPAVADEIRPAKIARNIRVAGIRRLIDVDVRVVAREYALTVVADVGRLN